jgi:ketosteroid isomerase-like protein
MRRSPELEALIGQWFAAATSGDASVVDKFVSLEPGTTLVGSDPDEWLLGGDAVAEFLRGEVTSSGGQADFSPSGTEAFEEGTVGWATTHLTITLPDGRSVSPRWSSVFHREGDGWRFVQTHASFGVGNDDVGWVYPD